MHRTYIENVLDVQVPLLQRHARPTWEVSHAFLLPEAPVLQTVAVSQVGAGKSCDYRVRSALPQSLLVHLEMLQGHYFS